MKNMLKILGITLIAAVIGFSFTACDDEDGTNTDPKVIVVTGFNASEFTLDRIAILLFDDDDDVVAAYSTALDGDSITFNLRATESDGSWSNTSSPKFTGTGEFIVLLSESAGNKFLETGTMYYMSRNLISITETTTTITLNAANFGHTAVPPPASIFK